MKNGFTVLELVIVIVILAILATIALPAYNQSREVTYNNQAKADLKLIMNSEKNYYLDMGYYYPSSGSVTNIDAINRNLSIGVPSGSERRWNITVNSAGCGQATRFGGDGRIWHMNITDAEPSSSACP